MNTLYYGDNLKILRDYIKDETVDLVYLDPPFNSNRNYNVLFKDESGVEADSQITAFEDTWHWNMSAERTYFELISEGDDVARMIESFQGFIGKNQMMAYLVMMAVRLKELHRVLKPTGSLYLHCDPTASHYLKILLDTIFGVECLRNEIVWARTTAKSLMTRRLPSNHDIIFSYQKTDEAVWNDDEIYTPYDLENLDEKTAKKYTLRDKDGRLYQLTDLNNPNPDRPNLTYEFLGITKVWRWTKERMQAAYDAGLVIQPRPGAIPRYKRYLDEQRGKPFDDVWIDIFPINSQAQERLGYPTQKPVALLERIIRMSSNEGDVVLDPFCGCGTTIAAAQKLNRQWIGIDITHLSIALQKYRLKDAFGLEPLKPGTQAPSPASVPKNADGLSHHSSLGTPGSFTPEEPALQAGAPAFPAYRIIGEPEDLNGARQLATEDRYQFQWWALSLIKARPLGGSTGSKEGKKGSDKGIDGTLVFVDDNSGKAKRVIVQVKSGHVKSGDIRDLGHTADRENAAIGVFITLEKPSRDMQTEAVGKGFYHSPGWNKDYPKLQILTVEELLSGKQVEMPQTSITFKQAEKMSLDLNNQGALGFD